ncbi:MAG: tetratricopeptide repeat protein [Deltaproteobacteria bacterium]|nr:tetratricopeptide repeat protein [Deltaproteobacteria bacterium]
MLTKQGINRNQAGYSLTAAIAAIAAVCLLNGCAGPAINKDFKTAPGRLEPAKTAKPAVTEPDAPKNEKPQQPAPIVQALQSKRPRSIGYNAMRHFKNATQTAEKSPAEALISLNLALASEPNFTEARYNLGILMLRLNSRASAKAEFEKAAETNFALGRIYLAMAILYVDEKNYAAAAETMLKALAEEPANSRILVNLASVYLLLGNQALADKTYGEAEARAPDDPYLNYNIGMLHMKAKEYDKAAKRFEKSLALKTSVPETSLAYAEALFEMGKYSDAKKAYIEAAALHPKAAAAHINLGILYELYLNDFKKAEESYSKYLELGGKRKSEVIQWIELLKEKSKP